MRNDLQSRLDKIASDLENHHSMAAYAAMIDTVSNTLDEVALLTKAAGTGGVLSGLIDDIGKAKDKVLSTAAKFDIKYLSALPEVLGGPSAAARATSLLNHYKNPSEALDEKDLERLVSILHAGYVDAGERMSDTSLSFEQKSELHALRKTIEDWTGKAVKVQTIWKNNGIVR